jgi:alkylhydroperoxidase family enzyme
MNSTHMSRLHSQSVSGATESATQPFAKIKPPGDAEIDAQIDAQIDALATLARTLVATRGTVPEQLVRAAKAHLSDSEIVDILLVIASITFANLFNRVNDAELDFPALH